nr:unnamed protein product [Callosobruchus analis]
MRWQIQLMVLLTLVHKSVCIMQDFFSSNDKSFEDESSFENSQEDLFDDEKLDEAIYLLTRLLLMPWPKDSSPLIYVEENQQSTLPNNVEKDTFSKYSDFPKKRSRYDPETFICSPSKEEVYYLLVALHDARQGYKHRVVDVCNRIGHAHTVLHNMRYIGK